ncbi:MAG TPA: excinuclease ABC subunit UvrC [bacterium]|nr:MAG: UvrABC system protein C [bacterium ADurb.Bin270]HPW44982.1 excinuclease ABC subunit UvrC [bacterium]
MNIKERTKNFPQRPGVYLFKGLRGEILYVGKAKNLRKRVGSYFRSSGDDRPQIYFLIAKTRSVDFIVTDSEKEALLLESTLIKKHKPRYNIELKDDKSHLYIRIGMEHPFPGISVTRRPKKEGAKYFGPYDSAAAAREAVEQITRFFQIRSCTDREFANRVRACLKHDIGRCSAPCVKKISQDEYALHLSDVASFLSGKKKYLVGMLKKRMSDASAKMDYEEAARCRDAIGMISDALERQNVIRHGSSDNDAIAMESEGSDCIISVMEVRSGAISGQRNYHLKCGVQDAPEVLRDFLLQRYVEGSFIPVKAIMESAPADRSLVEKIVSDRSGKKFSISIPKKGAAHRILMLALENAREFLRFKLMRKEDDAVFEKLSKKLALISPIQKIECVDISNTGGREAVGAIVSFLHGEPDKKNYRIFNIRTLTTPDDYAMMYEVIKRRYAENVEREMPDILLVDGGRGQLATAMRAVEELGLSLPLAAIAKGKKDDEPDQIFIPGRMNPVNIKAKSKELLLLMKVRDEAHRFAISAHRRRRDKKSFGK